MIAHRRNDRNSGTVKCERGHHIRTGNEGYGYPDMMLLNETAQAEKPGAPSPEPDSP